MCSNQNWIGILGGLAAAAMMLVTAYADKHAAHAQAPAAISAPGVQAQARSAP